MFQWLYGLFLNLLTYAANALLGVMSTDLTFFEESVPIVTTMYSVFLAVGWAMLLGNLVFQAMKIMFSGMGFETESPVTLFTRTGVFGFLLIFSRTICEIGLSISKSVIDMLGVPSSVTLTTPDDSFFGGAGDASWVIVIIVGFVLGFQLLKLFFEIGERYVIVAVLTLLSPLGFAMGGSKSTKEIFTGYIRMYASMLLMMVMNVVFLKLILSALATMPDDVLVLPWCVLVVAIARVARKIDSIISKIGLNPAITGEPLGRGRGMASYAVAKMVMNSVSKTGAGSAKGGSAGKTGTSRNNSTAKNGGASSQTTGSSKSSVNGQNTNTGPVSNSSANQNNTGNSRTNNNANSNANASSTQNAANNQNERHGNHANAQSNQNSQFGNNASAQTNQNARFGGKSSVRNNQTNTNTQGRNSGNAPGAGNTRFGAGGGVNTNRFGTTGGVNKSTPANPVPGKTTSPKQGGAVMPTSQTGASEPQGSKASTNVPGNKTNKPASTNTAPGKATPPKQSGAVMPTSKTGASDTQGSKPNTSAQGNKANKPASANTALGKTTPPKQGGAGTPPIKTSASAPQGSKPSTSAPGNKANMPKAANTPANKQTSGAKKPDTQSAARGIKQNPNPYGNAGKSPMAKSGNKTKSTPPPKATGNKNAPAPVKDNKTDEKITAPAIEIENAADKDGGGNE